MLQVRHAAASKPVGTGRGNGSRTNDSEHWGSDDTLLEVRYEEYFVEHDVSTADARRAAFELNVNDGKSIYHLRVMMTRDRSAKPLTPVKAIIIRP